MTAPALEQEWDYASLRPDQLPRGQHRNPSLARWRRVEAVRMATTGATCQQIADRLGLANRGTVSRMLKETFARHEVESVEQIRATELQRLDEMRVALAPRIAKGDPRAIMLALRITDARWRLLGLEPGFAWGKTVKKVETVVQWPEQP